MDIALQRMMGWRFQLTRTHDAVQNCDKKKQSDAKTVKGKYDPPLRYKEHALRFRPCHYRKF